MDKLKEAMMYIIVFIISLTVVFAFLDVFAFQKEDSEDDTTIEITDDDIALLYSYLPYSNDYGVATMYTKNYTTYSNLSSTAVGVIVYNYINEYLESMFEDATEDELNNIDSNIVKKINEDNFLSILHTIFGSSVEYSFKEFNISYDLKAIYENNYLYVVKKDVNTTSNHVVYKKYISYTVADNFETIKIYEYYLYCDIESNMCYNDERGKYLNSNIVYSEDLNIEDYLDYLVEYEHTFKYEDGQYYWYSTDEVS